MKCRLFTLLALHLGLAAVVAQPVITNQPQNQTAVAGSNATFSVGATGAPPLSYQWRSYANPNSYTNIPWGTEATLLLINVQPTSRRFGVVVTDAGGLSATSSPLVTLTVLPPPTPTITTNPASQFAEPGSTVTFRVFATGAAPLSYQWRSNDVNLLDQTNINLILTNVQFTSAADYSVVVTNVAGSATSQVARLTVSVLAGFENEMLSFMTANNVSAGTLAVMKDGRLAVKRGFGWRDQAKTQPMDADGRMRVASNSKEFAAAGLKRLIAQGAIALTNRAYSFTELQPYNGIWGDARYGDVTIGHLVAHQCGWDQNVFLASITTVGNALGLDRAGSSRDYIAYALTRPLHFAPGSRFAFSSVGYTVLAKAVEKGAGVPYFDYVRREVLRPWGLHRTKPARTLEKLRELDEPRYESGGGSGPNTADFPTTEVVQLPDGGIYPYEAAVGAFELISSAEEMVRFAQVYWISHGSAYSPNATVPAVMNGDLRLRRFGQVGAQSGWIPGTRTFVLQNTNGVDLAVLINRDIDDPGFSDFVSRLKQVSERIATWPVDDTPRIELGAASFGVEESEGHFTVGVRRSGDSSGAVAVTYTTQSGTALEGADFIPTRGTVGFGPGEITALISIPILDDTIEETNETFMILLGNPTGGASLGLSAATVTIEDDDTPRLLPLIQLTAPGAGFVSPAGSNVTLTVTTSASEGEIATVEYYGGPTFLGEENKPPYTFIWKKPSTGSYLLTARAADNHGLIGTSAPVRITVGTAPVDAGVGTIRREFWQRRPGTAMTFLTNYQHYSPRPTGWEILTSFEVQTDWGDFFGTRIRGFIEPPATGDYVFWVAARDRAELWLSADGNPSNKVVIASVQSPTAPRAWEQSSSQRSASIRLTAGQQCYIELLHKAEIGQDHAAVGWQLPGGQLERPIPGIRLLPVDAPASPQIHAPNLSSGEFGFHLNLTPGDTVVIEESPNLLNWLPLRTNTAAGSSLSFEDSEMGNSPHRFYRARLLP
jgi:CubicO group peptidase (beta-lactamase class C family)